MSAPEKSFEPAAGRPRDRVRVVDMSRLVAGNMISLQLADFGAEAIEIDVPVVERAQLLLQREDAIAAREAWVRNLT
jgi:crotonobetainyl-CoA:carnitine CoA-transferase CaiB-like acyl-CoA transferase